MEDVIAAACPACGHPMKYHEGRHCAMCDRRGVQCGALEPGVESPGG